MLNVTWLENNMPCKVWLEMYDDPKHRPTTKLSNVCKWMSLQKHGPPHMWYILKPKCKGLAVTICKALRHKKNNNPPKSKTTRAELRVLSTENGIHSQRVEEKAHLFERTFQPSILPNHFFFSSAERAITAVPVTALPLEAIVTSILPNQKTASKPIEKNMIWAIVQQGPSLHFSSAICADRILWCIFKPNAKD